MTQHPTKAPESIGDNAVLGTADSIDDATGAGATADPDERYLVPALVRGFDVLRELAERRTIMTLSEVAAALSVTRSSAFRLLYTLEHLGVVESDPQTKGYKLGAQILSLGYGYLVSRDLVEVAMPHLVRMRDRTGWSAHLGELQGREVVYLARVPTRRSVASTVHVGTRLPARSTTMGRILLSGLSDDEVRELYEDEFAVPLVGQPAGSLTDFIAQLRADRINGVVVQNGGFEPGVASVAAPIRDQSGRVVAAINISVVAMFSNDAELNGPLGAEVVASAAAISQALGYVRPVDQEKVPPHLRVTAG